MRDEIYWIVTADWPDEAAKGILDGFGSVYMTPCVGATQSEGTQGG